MNRNRREIILDFTSLLDVIMILLFFFVIFAGFESAQAVEKAQEETQKAQEELQRAQEESDKAAEELEKAEKLRAEAEVAYEELKEGSERSALNLRGIVEFGGSSNLKLFLSGNKEDWQIVVNIGDEQAGSIDDVRSRSPEDLCSELSDIMEENQLTSDSVILCELLYNSLDIGSNKAKKNTDEMLRLVRLRYEHFFCSRTDLSDFEEVSR